MASDLLIRPGDVTKRNLRDWVETHGERAASEMLVKGLKSKQYDYRAFPLRMLAEAFLGREAVEAMDPMNAQRGGVVMLGEAGGSVDSTAFSNVQGQIFYNAIWDGFQESDGGIFEKICKVVPTRLSGEKIGGSGKIKDEEFEVKEGLPYPTTGFTEQYIDTPKTKKFGAIIEITKEAIFFDRTATVLEQATRIGERLGTGRAKRMLKTVAGIDNSFNWKGTAHNTYLVGTDESSNPPWINKRTSAPLTSWKSVESAELLFANMTDPDTGNPIMVPQPTLLVVPALYRTAKRIVKATNTWEVDNQVAASTVRSESANPIEGDIKEIISSTLLRKVLMDSGLTAAQADSVWILFDPMRAFWYMQNWDIQVVQAPPQNPDEFYRDVVAAYKTGERGIPAVREPRFAIYNQGS